MVVSAKRSCGAKCGFQKSTISAVRDPDVEFSTLCWYESSNKKASPAAQLPAGRQARQVRAARPASPMRDASDANLAALLHFVLHIVVVVLRAPPRWRVVGVLRHVQWQVEAQTRIGWPAMRFDAAARLEHRHKGIAKTAAVAVGRTARVGHRLQSRKRVRQFVCFATVVKTKNTPQHCITIAFVHDALRNQRKDSPHALVRVVDLPAARRVARNQLVNFGPNGGKLRSLTQQDN